MERTVYAPFTEDQVNSLTDYQTEELLPPYICTRHHGNNKLRATDHGLVCDTCHHIQNWAHEMTVNEGWRKLQE